MADELPMRDVVKMVLEAEDESKQILEEASAKVERIAAKARRESMEIVQTARRETAEQVDAIRRQAEQEAEREKQLRLEQAAADIENMGQLDDQAVQTAVQSVLHCVCRGP